MIYVCVPLHRPRDIPNVLANFAAQTVRDRALVIVENGDAVGAWAGAAREILHSDASPGAARNKALQWVRDREPDAIIAFWDADDYYGPRYLAEQCAGFCEGDVIGKSTNNFVRLSDGLHLFQGKRNQIVDQIGGATIVVCASDAVDFDETMRCGEDRVWCDAMRAAGKRIYATSHRNFAYDRSRPGHSWGHGELLVRSVMGPGMRFGEAPNSCADEGAELPESEPVTPPSEEQIFAAMSTADGWAALTGA